MTPVKSYPSPMKADSLDMDAPEAGEVCVAKNCPRLRRRVHGERDFVSGSVAASDAVERHHDFFPAAPSRTFLDVLHLRRGNRQADGAVRENRRGADAGNGQSVESSRVAVWDVQAPIAFAGFFIDPGRGQRVKELG